MLEDITPVILTGDEEANIERTLRQLAWAHRVVVVDSMSEDRTVAIARSFPNVIVHQRAFDDLASQWRYAVVQAETPWVLTLDADYFVPDAFTRELAGLALDADGYEAEFVYAMHGRPLRASLYPPRAVLLRAGRHEFFMDGHTQRVRVSGEVRRLRERLIHDDRKPLSRFIARQRRYMRDEAAKLRAASWSSLPPAGKLRKLRVVAPFAVLVHTLFVRGVILDGLAGLQYAFERVVAELILSRELLRGR